MSNVNDQAYLAWRPAALVMLAFAAVAATLSMPPVSDPPFYFDFADHRTILGIPRFMDVVSNAPWAFIGLSGLLFTWRAKPSRRGPFEHSWERSAALVLFASMAAIALGSAWFHLNPNPASLLWDRLPMAAVFMSFLALVIGDRLGSRAGRMLLSPLVSFGLLSVLFWQFRGDLRLYLLAQFFPILFIPLMLLLCPARYTRSRDIWLCLALYVLAKSFELTDAQVHEFTGVLSGHTLKHLAGAAASYFVLRNMRLRKPAANPTV